jgi:hypothetical protein
MAATGLNSPAHRFQPRVAIGGLGGAPDQAPNIDYGGSGIQDPRLIYNTANSATGAGIIGWVQDGTTKCTAQVPSAISTTNIAAAANVVNGTPMTLVSATGAGITVVPAGGFVMMPNYGRTWAAGTLAIDGLPGYVQFGSKFITAFYDPTKGISRAVSITGSASSTGGNFLISGGDWYGYPMSQLLTVGAGAVTANTTKTFKFISSVIPQFTDAHNYSVGTADIYGYQIAADIFADTDVYWANVIQVVAQFTPAVTATATTTTGDVRGVFAAPSASDGTKRLDIFIVPSLNRLATKPMSVGLFGVTQV